jgi:hypothetical protein
LDSIADELNAVAALVPIRNATLVGSFAIMLLIFMCLLRALTWHITCCKDRPDTSITIK